MTNLATTYDLTHPLLGIIAELEEVQQWSVKAKNRNGYFAALYKNITSRVKHAIENEEFEDNARMAHFVQVFAHFYLDAHKQFREGTLQNSNPWKAVLELGRKRLTIVQHLLLGINVHINYDLANTCNQICAGPPMMHLCGDFVKINMILSTAITQVEKEIFTLSPLLSILARMIRKLERKMLDFSVTVARSKSWECACLQATADFEEKTEIQSAAMTMTLKFVNRIAHPGKGAGLIVFFIRMLELHSIQENLRVLNEKAEIATTKPIPQLIKKTA